MKWGARVLRVRSVSREEVWASAVVQGACKRQSIIPWLIGARKPRPKRKTRHSSALLRLKTKALNEAHCALRGYVRRCHRPPLTSATDRSATRNITASSPSPTEEKRFSTAAVVGAQGGSS